MNAPITGLDPRFNAVELYDVYTAKLAIRRRICGGMPKNPEILKTWIATTTKHDDELTTKQEQEAREVLLAPTEEKSWNGFPADDKGIFVWSRAIKAMFKEAATMLRITVDKLGSKQIFQHGFEIKGLEAEDRVYLGKMVADGYEEGPIHVQTPAGPRTALKRVDYCEKPIVQFNIWVLSTSGAEKRHVGEADLVRMLNFSQENGLGAERAAGKGKFNVLDFGMIHRRTHAEKEEKPASKAKAKAKAAEAAAE